MNRRIILRPIGICLMGYMFALPSLWAQEASKQQRPNIVIIFTDDQQYDSYGANGRSKVQTPVLDRLAERGVRFTNAHAALSLCSPSRAAVLTGRYGSANGVQQLGAKLREGEVAFSQDLKHSGYTTLFSGKWHLKNTPQDLGFDRVCSFRGNGTYFGRKVNDEGRQLKPEEHIDLYCARKSAEMIKDAAEQDKPFVLFHCTQLPHMDGKLSWPAAKKFNDLYTVEDMPLPTNWNDSLKDKPDYLKEVRNRSQAKVYGYDKPKNIRKHAKDYYAVVSEMDSFLGLVLKSLKENGVEDNTYVIYMSDNGWMLGDHGMTSKVLPFTTSTRVPLVLTGPGIKPGVCDTPALNLDLTATIYDLAGVEPTAKLHGRSLLPMVDKDLKRTIIHECLGGYGGNDPFLAAINERWLYIQTLAKDNHKKITFEELYDKDRDPEEMKNLVSSPEHAAMLKDLRAKIAGHRTSILQEDLRRTPVPKALDDMSHFSTEGNWKVEKNVIYLEPRPGERGWKRYASYLWLKGDYDDFICEFDYKHEAKGNSGFYFRVGDVADPVDSGIEVQLNDTHHKAELGFHDLGGVLVFIKRDYGNPIAKATKPPGQWNSVRVTMKDNLLTVVINDITVQDHLDLSKEEIDGAKLSPTGKIGFQDHGKPFWLRNIKIIRL